MTTSPLTLAIAAWLLPAAAFLVLGVLYPLRRSGRPAALVSIVAILGSLVAAIAAWRIAEAGAVQVALWEWLPAHDGPLASVGALADEQSLVMLVLVALVACLVQVYSLGYLDHEPPAGMVIPEGTHYNPFFIGGKSLSMAPPLSDDQVTYDDGSPQTVDQYARDVSAFLMWAAEPHLEERKKTGFRVMVFLVLFAGLVYLTKRKVWANVH